MFLPSLGSLVRLLVGGSVAAVLAASCVQTSPIQEPIGGNGGGGVGGGTTASSSSTGSGVDPSTACILNNCNSDPECAGCANGRTSCLLSEHRCVACGPDLSCPAGTVCASFGDCVPEGATCPTDPQGNPTVSCSSSADCVACDPKHQVCDPATARCVACTSNDTSACNQTDRCVDNLCAPRCPATCSTDNDCSKCGVTGHFAHACNNGQCSQCSPTYACPSGTLCAPQGVCIAKCGQDGDGSCYDDDDCTQCGAEASQCHKPLNGPGKCGPAAAGCSDLGQGTVVLPSPWNQVTNLCSNDGDCSGVGIQLNVGKLLRDITGIDDIKDANLSYGMNACAAVSVGVGNTSLSCGVCVPCREDTDCQPIDVDAVAGQAFGPLGSVAAAILLDQIFGQNDHDVHMYCAPVAGGYGVCAPCPGVVYACGGN